MSGEVTRAGWEPPQHCPHCGSVIDVQMGVDVDLTDGYDAPVSVELLCSDCDWRLTVSLG